MQEGTRIGGQVPPEDDGAGLVEDAHGKSPGMQIDAGRVACQLWVARSAYSPGALDYS